MIVNNTSAVGLVKPIEYGVDIIIDSTTKFLEEHGTSIGGVIITSDKFD